MPDRDHDLDALLRDVPAPPRPDRFTAAALFADDVLDRMAADVPLPAGLVDRLRGRIVAAPDAGRGGIDFERVAAPGSPAGRRPHVPRRRVRFGALGLVRDGIVVVAALTAAWLFLVTGQAASSRLAGPAPARSTARGGAPHLHGHDAIHADEAAPAQAMRDQAMRDQAMRDQAMRDQAMRDQVSAPAADADRGAGIRRADEAATAGIEASASPADVVTDARHGVGAAPGIRGAAVAATAPRRPFFEPAAIPVAAASWRAVPKAPAYDLAFELAHGEAAFLDPALGPATDRPPLVLDTDSYDRVRQAGRRAAWRALRTEHVLAAVPAPGAPPGAADVRLSLHGVRSLRTLNGTPSILVEVAAEAGAAAAAVDPRFGVVVLDRSRGGSPLVWQHLCRALAAAGRAMSADDRLSVVVAGPVARLAVRRADAAMIRDVAEELGSMPPSDVADLDAAVAVAIDEAGRDGRLVVATHAETADRCRHAAADALAAWRRSLAEAGGDAAAAGRDAATSFILVDPLPPGPDGRPSPGRTAAMPTAIRRTLLGRLFGDAAVVARGLRLDVSFAPRLVAAYRLVGHRQSAVESLSPPPPPLIDLHVGETVRVVYEVVPRGRLAEAAVSATAAWEAAATHAPRTLRSALADADDLAESLPTPHACELLLATSLGEAVTKSPHADARVVKRAGDLLRRWRDRGDVTSCGEDLAAVLDAARGGAP